VCYFPVLPVLFEKTDCGFSSIYCCSIRLMICDIVLFSRAMASFNRLNWSCVMRMLMCFLYSILYKYVAQSRKVIERRYGGSSHHSQYRNSSAIFNGKFEYRSTWAVVRSVLALPTACIRSDSMSDNWIFLNSSLSKQLNLNLKLLYSIF